MTTTRTSLLAGVFCLGLSVILFEIALTRVFAIMMWHHFTYMVISIGLLGFGASGSLLTATQLGTRPGAAERALVWTSLGYGIAVVLSFCFATLVRIDSLDIWQQKENFLALFFIYLIIFVPFLLGGLGIGLALTRYVQQVNRLYFADLVGSSLGAGLSVLVLRAFGGPATVVLAGWFGLLAAFCFTFAAPRRYFVLSLPGLVLGSLLVLGFTGAGRAIGLPHIGWRVPYAPGKEAAIAEVVLRDLKNRGVLGDQSPELDKIHSATAEVEVAASIAGPPMIGGDMGLIDGMYIQARGVGQDGAAPTMLYENAADLGRFPFLDDTQAASAYVARHALGHTDHEVMVIGVGGGVDVLVALANGARHVTAVELNTAMIEMVTERYDDYLGGLFTTSPLASRITLVNSEGRAWLRAHDARYDVIQMSGVDSYTALSSGAYTLSESYLYTVEAVQDFYSRLKPDGIVCWSRFIERAPQASRETLRLANIARAGLQRAGVASPAAHILVLQGQTWASTMIKQSPFTTAEVDALRDFSRRQGFVGLIFDPLRPPDSAFVPEPSHFALLLQRVEPPIAGSVRDLAGRHEGLMAFLDAAAGVARGEPIGPDLVPPAMRGQQLGEVVLKGVTDLRGAIQAQRDYLERTTADFLRLLHADDQERARLEAAYPFDIAPATDDRPFFFNYYRWSSLFRARSGADAALFTYQTEFPVGHLVLLGSLVQILLLAGVMIFLPLRRLAREGLRAPGAVRFFGYFAALGLGFMLIEIALMQKLVIFLGHPTYALSVVLTSLLAAAGIGSLLAGRIQMVRRPHLLAMLGAIGAAVLLDVIAINHLLPHLLGAPLAARVAVVVAMLVPTGLVLGMPFPSGIRLVEEQCPQLIPWGWAVNAFFSVFGSIFCIVLSMAIGFSNVFYVALLVYAGGLLGMKVPAPAAIGPAGAA